MRKIFLCIPLIILLSFDVSFNATATESFDAENLQSEISHQLEGAIDNNTLEILGDLGIREFNFDEIYSISFKNISAFFSETLKEKVAVALEDFIRLFSVVLLAGVVSALIKDYYDENFTGILCTVVVTLLAVGTVKDSLSAVVSVLELSGKFMLSFAPIYTLIVSLSGNTAVALTYNTFAVFFAEIISSVISGGAVDIIGVFFSLGISFSMNESININRFVSTVNRIVSTVLGFTASMFTGYLSLKNILSVSVDRVSVRSIRFLISSLIPVVGSSISEAYSTLIGSINLIKGSVAIVGIIVIIIINAPVIIETLVYYIFFNLLGYTSDILSVSKIGDVFRVFSAGIRILLLLCIFEMFILIISVGIILSVKGGG